MAATTPERYVVASCHVERPLDDRVWGAFAALQRRRPGGIAVAALLRPPDRRAGEEDDERWLDRARAAAAVGPLGHHCHWTSPSHARPTEGSAVPAERVLDEGRWLQQHGVRATLFCGGGWYTDRSVAAACAALGYADCTPRARPPGYLTAGAPWAELHAPALVRLGEAGSLVALPTTHSVGDAVREACRPSLAPRVHVYFHDTDLVDRRRRLVVEAALRLLGGRRDAWTLDEEREAVVARARSVEWSAVARGGSAEQR
jgi:hypothetical protein